jgi:hypothetical protein
MSALAPHTPRMALDSALNPSTTNSSPPEASRPIAQVAVSRVHRVAFSAVPSTTASGIFMPSAVTPSAPTSRC